MVGGIEGTRIRIAAKREDVMLRQHGSLVLRDFERVFAHVFCDIVKRNWPYAKFVLSAYCADEEHPVFEVDVLAAQRHEFFRAAGCVQTEKQEKMKAFPPRL